MTATSLDLSQIKTDALSSAATFRTLIGLGSSDTVTFKEATLTSGTVTSSTPVINATQTWNDGATTFTGILANITDTASASGSLLMDLQVGGSSKFNVDKSGIIRVPQSSAYNTANIQAQGFNTGFSLSANTVVSIISNGVGVASFKFNQGLLLKSSLYLGFGNANVNGAADTILVRDAANTLAQRNSTNAQTFRLYNTYTSSTSFENLQLQWNTNEARIGTSVGSAGGTQRDIVFGSWDSAGTWNPSLTIQESGDILFRNTSNTNYLTPTLRATGFETGFSFGNTTLYYAANNLGIFASGTSGANRLFFLHNAASFGWGSSDINGAPDTLLFRDAAYTIAQRNGTNAQTFRIYNTYTDASNYERASLKWDSNLFKIGTESLGTGTARDVAIINNGNVVANFLSDRFYLGPVSDGTAVGGNARGQYAVDLQLSRTAATQVASGNYSFVAGINCQASTRAGFAMGNNCVASSTANSQVSFAMGSNCTASSWSAFALGASCSSAGSEASFAIGYGSSTVSGAIYGAVAIGRQCVTSSYSGLASGYAASSYRYAMRSHASGRFSSTGDAQHSLTIVRNKTTDTTPTNLFIDGSSTRITIPSGKIYAFTAKISGIKSDGTAAAFYTRKGCIKNVGGTTTLVGSIETIGTDIEDSATAVAITADDTNDALDIQVTGIAAETWRWVAVIEGVEIAYGT